MRPGRAAGRADRADALSLRYMIADLHVDARQVEESAVEPMTMVDHQQMTFQCVGRAARSEDDDAIRGRHYWLTRRGGDVHPAMIGAGLSLIDALRSEQASNW